MTENLPLLTPDTARGARTKSRCHERLAARRRRLEARSRPPHRRVTLSVERLLLASLCVAYLVSMAGNVLSIAGGP
jgi:hypothetical protein